MYRKNFAKVRLFINNNEPFLLFDNLVTILQSYHSDSVESFEKKRILQSRMTSDERLPFSSKLFSSALLLPTAD